MRSNARWSQNGVTVAGGNGCGGATNQLNGPEGFDIDDHSQSVVIADVQNHRIVEWKINDENGKVVAGGRGQGRGLDQLNYPTDVLIDQETNSLLIADRQNRRVLQWSRHPGTTKGNVILKNISCCSLAMDHKRCLYASDDEKHEVRRFLIGDMNGILVAGGNEKGCSLNQLNYPTYLSFDAEQAMYVSDRDNHRVMKWEKGAEGGIIVAGQEGEGSALAHLNKPNGLIIDVFGTLYIADDGNDRVMRWPKNTQQGTVIVGGNGRGKKANQLHRPEGLSFDRQGNLYVVDWGNHRIQRFNIQ